MRGGNKKNLKRRMCMSLKILVYSEFVIVFLILVACVGWMRKRVICGEVIYITSR